MKRSRTNPGWPAALVVALLAGPPGARIAAAQTRVSISHVVVGPSQVPLWIAHEQKFFAKRGIDAQLIDETSETSTFRSLPLATVCNAAGVPSRWNWMEDLVDDRFVRKLDESGELDRPYGAYGVK